jgi:hypothetical protein
LQPAVLRGSILSGGKPEELVTVTLTKDTGEVFTVTASSDAYTATELQPGSYVVTASKNGCATLTAELTLESGDNTWDVKLCPVGDVTGDRSLNIGDVGRLYSHVRKLNLLQDDYVLLCADYNGDGTINIGDVVKLYSFIRN